MLIFKENEKIERAFVKVNFSVVKRNDFPKFAALVDASVESFKYVICTIVTYAERIWRDSTFVGFLIATRRRG